jgi:2-polyprenyl-3-methyl-5-hydroxy-6-metoxy-1,4-benzoquinol methylase
MNTVNFRWKIAQAAEIRWWQQYLRGRTPAEYAVWKTDYWKQFVSEIGVQLPTERNAQTHFKVLDAGCGPAGIFTIFPAPYQVDALDPLLMQYEQKLPHFRRFDYPNVRFLNQPLEDLDARNEYDIIFCLNAINHVADLETALDQLIGSAKVGATVVVSIDAHNYSLLKKIFRLVPGDILHPHQYDLNEYVEMLTKRGVQIESKILKKQENIFNYYILVGKKC